MRILPIDEKCECGHESGKHGGRTGTGACHECGSCLHFKRPAVEKPECFVECKCSDLRLPSIDGKPLLTYSEAVRRARHHNATGQKNQLPCSARVRRKDGKLLWIRG